MQAERFLLSCIPMAKTATLILDDKELSLPIIVGTEAEKAVDKM